MSPSDLPQKPNDDEAPLVDIDNYEEEDVDPDPVPVKAARERRPRRAREPKQPINKLTFVLTVLLAIAVVIIVRQAGMGGMGGSGEVALPENHPDISQMDVGQIDALDEEKVAELQAVLEESPDDLDALKELGKTYVDARHYQDALDALNKAIEVAPDDLESHLMAGVCEYSLNNFDAAKARWITATELDPSKAEPWFNLGFVYLMEDPVNDSELTRAWDKVLELAPDSDMADDVRAYRESAADGN